MSERYYHGGVPGLPVSGFILPPDKTGAPSVARFGAAGICRTDRVYITTDLDSAVMIAALHPSGRGCVYEVAPLGELEADPDCLVNGLSYQTSHAQIISRMKVPGKIVRKVLKVLAA